MAASSPSGSIIARSARLCVVSSSRARTGREGGPPPDPGPGAAEDTGAAPSLSRIDTDHTPLHSTATVFLPSPGRSPDTITVGTGSDKRHTPPRIGTTHHRGGTGSQDHHATAAGSPAAIYGRPLSGGAPPSSAPPPASPSGHP